MHNTQPTSETTHTEGLSFIDRLHDLDDLLQLTNIDQVEQGYRYLQAVEAQTEAELSQILEERQELQRQFSELHTLAEQVRSLQLAVAPICDRLTTTAQRAEQISGQVKHLDSEQTKIELALKHVTQTQRLGEDLALLRTAIDTDDIEKAAALVHYYLILNRDILTNPFINCLDLEQVSDRPDAAADSSSDRPKSVLSYLTQAREVLKQTVSDRFDSAAQNWDTRGISLCFKLFPMLDEVNLGLDKYSELLCDMVREKSKIPLQSGKWPPDSIFAIRLTKLFETVAAVIDNHFSIVETHYGPGKMLRVIQRLQLEVDRRVQNIFDAFEDEYQIKRLVAEIQQFHHGRARLWSSQGMSPRPSLDSAVDQAVTSDASSTTATASQGALDPKHVSKVLSELVIMYGQASVYQHFLRSRARSNLDSLPEGEPRDALFLSTDWTRELDYRMPDGGFVKFDAVTGLLAKSYLDTWLEWLFGTYTIVERYTMSVAVDRAIKIDDFDSLAGWDSVGLGDSPSAAGSVGKHLKGILRGMSHAVVQTTSSCVDDFFFVLQCSIERAVSVHQPAVLREVIQASMSHLQTHLLTHLERQALASSGVAAQQPSWRSIKQDSSSAKQAVQRRRLVALNNLDASIDCIASLTKKTRGWIEEERWASLVGDDTQTLGGVIDALDAFASISAKFNQILDNG
ncbi:Golgi transport complex subunit 4, partial [Spiromyces aspiralis]